MGFVGCVVVVVVVVVSVVTWWAECGASGSYVVHVVHVVQLMKLKKKIINKIKHKTEKKKTYLGPKRCSTSFGPVCVVSELDVEVRRRGVVVVTGGDGWCWWSQVVVT